MAGWGDFFGKVAEQFQSRAERLKNEKERLENEKSILTTKPWSASGSRRLIVVDDRLRQIEKILVNAAR